MITLFAIITLLVVALQFPATQNFITSRAINYIQSTIGTRVELKEINVGFPKSVVLKGLYLEDQSGDTLLYVNRLAVNIDMWGLIRQRVQVNSIEVERLTAHVQRTLPDSTFNFDYIINAFASENDAVVEEDTSDANGWDVSLYELILKDIYLTYVDEVSGNDVNLNLGEFKVEMDEFDLNQNQYHLGLLALNNSRLRVIQSKEVPDDEEEDESTTDLSDYDVALGRIIIDNVNIDYQHLITAQQMLLSVGDFEVEGDEIDLAAQKIGLNKIALHNSELQFILNENIVADSIASDVEKVVSEEEGDSDLALAFFINEVDLSGNRIRFNNYNEPQQDAGMDFNHLDLQGLNLNIQAIEFHGQAFKADLQQLAFIEQSGFKIDRFSASLAVDSTSASIQNMHLNTGESQIQNTLVAHFPSLENIADDIEKISLNLNIDAEIGFRDIFYLQPELAKSLHVAGNLDKKAFFSGNVEGLVSNLNIHSFEASLLQATQLAMSGNIRGLPETENLFLDINLNNFLTSRADLQNLMPPGSMPEGMQLPQNVRLEGAFRGTLEDFATNLNLRTSDGNVSTELRMKPVYGRQSYAGMVAVEDLNVGKIIGQEDMGLLSLQMNVDGAGLEIEEMEASLQGVIQKFEYNNYQYNNLMIDGRLEQQQFVGQANMDDENLKFGFDGNINLNDEERPVVDFLFNLEHVDLQALNFMEDPLTLSFEIEADLAGMDMNDINGNFGIRNLDLNRNGDQFHMDSLLVGSIQEARRTEINIESELFSVNLTGTVNLGDLGPTITRHLNRYFDLHDDEIDEDLEPQNFEFQVVIHNTDFLSEFLVPDLERFVPGNISGSYTSENMNLDMNIEFPEIVYQTTTVNNLRLNIDSDRNQLNYILAVDDVLDSSFHIQNLALLGEIQNNIINTRFQLLDDEEEVRYLLGGILESVEDVFRFSFEQGQVVLDYEEWSVPQNNFIEFGPEGVVANDVRLERQGQIFAVNSHPNLDMEIEFENFSLATLSRMIEREDVLLRGLLSGNFIIDNQREEFAFTADLNIQDFSFQEDTLGTISLLASNPMPNRYDVDFQISGAGNQVSASGYYQIAEDPEAAGILDFDINVQNLNLASIEAYTAGQLQSMEGALRGQLKATGTTDAPTVRGELRFQQAGFNLVMLNTFFRLENERIVFDEQGINFPNFRMTDAANNVAVITGLIATQDYTDFQFGLDVRSRNFRVLATTEADNELYYGNLLLDTDLRIRGNMDLPEVEGSLNFREGTNLTLVIPAAEAGLAEMAGIVEFVNMSEEETYPIEDTLTTQTGITGMNLNIVLRTHEQAQFTVLMDPTGTDALAIRGNADLNLAIPPTGNMTLTGRYEIVEGSYALSFMGMVNRRFVINPGSSIIWHGDPMDATLDIRAIYNVRTAPINLLQDRFPDQTTLRQARQSFPFMVYLNMAGELMSPEISFGLDMPEEQRGAIGGSVYTVIQELNQEQQIAELNKQVFALLVLNSFIAQDPLASPGGGGVESAARRSVSNLLTTQLNRLADRYITGFDINIGVDSYDDFSTGDEAASVRTDVQVGVSRQFLDNRITVQVGGNINVEGGERTGQQQQGLSDIAGNISVMYDITEDARYRIRGFRETTFESVIDGQLIETGLGLIFRRDYNRLSELFRRSREEENIIEINEEDRSMKNIDNTGN